MALTSDQLRAARALLKLSQEELANETGVAVSTIRLFELGGTTSLQQKTENTLLAYLGEKIEFIGSRGVALREADHFVLEGKTAIAQVFEDIHAHLRGQEGAETLFLCGENPCLFSPELIGYCAGLKAAGFSYRSICHKKDETDFVRVAPTNFAPLPLQIVYGSTVAQMVGPDRILLTRSPMLAKGLRQAFELLWAALPALSAETDEPILARPQKALRA